MVANGSMTEAPLSLTYYYVVSRDSFCVALLIAGLNDLDIMACDVGNVYLNVPCRYNILFVAGPEHGPEKTCKVMVMFRDLYGLKSSVSAWRNISVKALRDMDFVPTVANQDIYRRQARKTNGDDYYELLLLYVND